MASQADRLCSAAHLPVGRLLWILICTELTRMLRVEVGEVTLLEGQVHSRKQHEGIVPEGE